MNKKLVLALVASYFIVFPVVVYSLLSFNSRGIWTNVASDLVIPLSLCLHDIEEMMNDKEYEEALRDVVRLEAILREERAHPSRVIDSIYILRKSKREQRSRDGDVPSEDAH